MNSFPIIHLMSHLILMNLAYKRKANYPKHIFLPFLKTVYSPIILYHLPSPMQKC